ncbi:hypothetical protein ASPVEDRAFT_733008 [Aspergillus versicolor CBS 583.65]|uniref:Alpha/beta hydrolase fold-3 domain-containing protein n=1 Tax=Aspergillus versicolor CBS 583.65 TaxID=1036611 RepID=A0A1L9PPK1_ASPVE|nr:uncharacterized protein ASPVEDRAFT_733008 [Aspergillus versicolor CBS 583.65]OJJ03457.1 hypothetical protein ASPVEDRAFT_733008 [Aspergillus versicolor CBS 583.65]
MMDQLLKAAEDTSRFDDFLVLTTTYKTLHDHRITTDVLIPKSLTDTKFRPVLETKPRPILLRYHGGGLVFGHSLFPPFFSPWYLQLAQEYSAVIVSPNYRLLPESSVMEILQDIEHHWQWMHKELAGFLDQHTSGAVQADLTRIMTLGDSAGGYLSLQMGLSHPDEIRAVNAVYPLVNPKAWRFNDTDGKPHSVFGGLPVLPEGTLARHMESIRAQREASPGRLFIQTEASDLTRLELMFALTQHGQLGHLFSRESIDPYPLDRIDSGARFPKGGVLILHGRDDSVAPLDQSLELQKKLETAAPDTNFALVIRDGEHGFDHTAKLYDSWLWEAVQGITRTWLQ